LKIGGDQAILGTDSVWNRNLPRLARITGVEQHSVGDTVCWHEYSGGTKDEDGGWTISAAGT
jgi:hypothetical protein